MSRHKKSAPVVSEDAGWLALAEWQRMAQRWPLVYSAKALREHRL